MRRGEERHRVPTQASSRWTSRRGGRIGTAICPVGVPSWWCAIVVVCHRGGVPSWCCDHHGAWREDRCLSAPPGLSQAALARLVGRPESWLSKVEQGIRSVDRLSVLLDIDRVLHVDVEALIVRPWQLAPNGGPVADGFDDMGRVFTHSEHLLGTESAPTVSLARLRAGVVNAHRGRVMVCVTRSASS